MAQNVLRIAPEADGTPSTAAKPQGRAASRFSSVLEPHFHRVMLIVLFTVFLTVLYGLGDVMKMNNTLNEMKTTIYDISTTSHGNRVVSCADLSVRAPALAASLPQCASTGR